MNTYSAELLCPCNDHQVICIQQFPTDCGTPWRKPLTMIKRSRLRSEHLLRRTPGCTYLQLSLCFERPCTWTGQVTCQLSACASPTGGFTRMISHKGLSHRCGNAMPDLFSILFRSYKLLFTSGTSILKRKRNATVLNPLFLLHGPHEANFLIISCVPAH